MLPTPPRPIEVISLASSAISYTLYLMHFPLLSLIVLTGFAPHRLQPSVTAAAVYGILLFLAIVWAATVWWCFERNTGRVYNFLFEYLALGEARGKPIEASKRA